MDFGFYISLDTIFGFLNVADVKITLSDFFVFKYLLI